MGRKNDLSSAIKKAMDVALERTAEELTFKIENAYEKAIDDFYNSYTPHMYDRTYSTYLASDRYNSVFNAPFEHVGDSIVAGVNISDSNIPGNPYRADKDWVFERTFEKGIHGYTYNEYKAWKESAEKKITARRDGYQLMFRWYKNMNKMKKPPKEYMDKWFKHEIMSNRGKAEIDKIFTEELAKALNN